MTALTEAADKDLDALANRFFDAIERADIEAVERRMLRTSGIG